MVILNLLRARYEFRCENFQQAFRRKCSELELDADLLDSLFPETSLPYHNKRHMVNVAFDADFLASMEELPLKDRRNLFVAGLYHDINHTGVSKPDTDNLVKVEEFFIRHQEEFLSSQNVDLLKDVFPAVLGTNTDFYRIQPSYLGGLLRDADLLGWAYIDF